MEMRKRIAMLLFSCGVLLCACGRQSAFPALETAEGDGYMAIVWEDRTYIPFCVVSKTDCGKSIGCLNGDPEDIVSEYKDYAPQAWIANYLTMDGGALLYKEASVTEIPDGLESEYPWNQAEE